MEQYNFGDTPLTITTVGALYKTILDVLTKSRALTINLGLINKIDSAGIAFLLELKSVAKQKHYKLEFINISDSVQNFCQLYQISL